MNNISCDCWRAERRREEKGRMMRMEEVEGVKCRGRKWIQRGRME